MNFLCCNGSCQINGVSVQCRLSFGHKGACEFLSPESMAAGQTHLRAAFFDITKALENLSLTERRRVILAACLVYDVQL